MDQTNNHPQTKSISLSKGSLFISFILQTSRTNYYIKINIVTRVEFTEGRAYAHLTSTLASREVVSDRPSAQNNYQSKINQSKYLA